MGLNPRPPTCQSSAQRTELIGLSPISWAVAGWLFGLATPAFHVFAGADNTGRFSRIGKSTWWKSYLKAGDDVLEALKMLSS